MSKLSVLIRTSLAAAILMTLAIPAFAGEARIAVAANFTAAATEIGALFEKKSPHRASFSFASTGTLYTQISQGAPFDGFLAADRIRPEKATDAGFAVAGSRFTYAVGRIALYSKDPALVTGPKTLSQAQFHKIALANPVTAPYGAAAIEVLDALGLRDALSPRFVQGKNIAQTYQFVETGNAELGFVALSQIAGDDNGSRWVVPYDLYEPIRQDAVLLTHGAGNEAAQAFLAFLRSPDADAVKSKFGYGSGD